MEENKSKNKTRVIQLSLFIITIITTTFAGAEWMYGKYFFFGEELLTFSEALSGLYFSIPFLVILTVHEFGHYFTARHHNIKVTLPYYIPLWLGFLSIPFTIGTMGAFIRIKQLIQSRKEYFDVGIAGPLAGFVMALIILTYGFTHLPEPEYIYEIHPEYREYGSDYQAYYDQLPINLAIGDNLLFIFYKNVVADPDRVPNKYELYHYPWIFAGFLALFFTALNLIPIGQLDGGHVIYGLFGYKRSRIVSRTLFLIMITISGIGWIPQGQLNIDFAISLIFYLFFLVLAFYNFEKDLKKRILIIIWVLIVQIFCAQYFAEAADYGIYMVFAFLLGRFLGVEHPKALEDKPLDLKRKILGWIALGVFIISFTPRPIYFEYNEKARIEQPGPSKENPSPSKVVARRMVEIF